MLHPALGSDNVEVAVGLDHACVRKTSGAVVCFGSNAKGQLGDGSLQSSLAPVPVEGLVGSVRQIVARAKFSCALVESGAVSCWGANFKTSPTPVEGLKAEVSAIFGGSTFFCAVNTQGVALCAGTNEAGQLGRGTVTSKEMEVAPVVGIPGRVIKVAGAQLHACALVENGDVFCWGWNGFGNFGIRGQAGIHTKAVKSTLLSGAVVDIAAGGAPWDRADALSGPQSRTCVLRQDGKVSCEGSWQYGQSGDGVSDPQTYARGPVQPIRGAVAALSSAGAFTCASTAEHRVSCWGLGLDGALGQGTDVWRRVSLGQAATQLVSKADRSCALLSDGSLECWGGRSIPRFSIEQSSTHVNLAPRARTSPEGPAERLTIQHDEMCAATDAGAVTCWTGDVLASITPTVRRVDRLSGPIRQLASGDAHSCALMASGQVWCWGRNESGQLGQPNGMPKEGIFQVAVGQSQLRSLGATKNRSCVRDEGGELRCWGAPLCGLTDDPQAFRAYPGTSLVELDDGLCVRNRKGTLECFVDARDGVGRPVMGTSCAGSWREVVLERGTHPHLVSGNSRFLCGSSGDTRLDCTSDEPGFGASGREVSFSFPSSVSRVAAGSAHLCVLLESGEVWCAGDETKGQLASGNGVVSRPIEVQR
jgi:alpha-tubulin suppressor-like RCC1 family protein